MATDVVKGVVLLEGSFPIDHLHPALKHLLHYGKQTADTGLLDWCSMFCFERKNKEVKKLTRNTSSPLSSLANHTELDIVTRLQSLGEKITEDFRQEHIRLAMNIKQYVLSDREKTGLTMLGVTSFVQCKAFKVLTLLGVHFKGGEWGKKRCGSVVTTIHRQVSRYCIVKVFLELQGKAYASVTWLSTPTYPCLPFKLVVKVRMLTPAQQRQHRSVVPVDRIDPCTVAVLPHNDGVHFYMLRDKGTDRTDVNDF